MTVTDKRIGTTWGCFDCARGENGLWAKYRVTADYNMELDMGVSAYTSYPCGLCATELAGVRFRFAIWEGGN